MGFIDIWAIDFEYGRVFCGAANKDLMEAYIHATFPRAQVIVYNYSAFAKIVEEPPNLVEVVGLEPTSTKRQTDLQSVTLPITCYTSKREGDPIRTGISRVATDHLSHSDTPSFFCEDEGSRTPKSLVWNQLIAPMSIPENKKAAYVSTQAAFLKNSIITNYFP